MFQESVATGPDGLHLRVCDGAGPLRAEVVLAHGYAEHGGRYRHVAERLVDAGFRVWIPDHRGHGQSPGPRGDVGSWKSAVADVDAVVEQAAEAGRPVFLVGHSLGGVIGLAYAVEHGQKLAGLALSGSALVLPPEMLALVDLPEIPVLDVAAGVSSDPAVVEDYRADPLNHLGAMPRNLLEILHELPELITRLPEITLPIQIMHGGADALIPVASLRTIVNGVSSTDLTARIWPGLFHEIFNEPSKDEVIGALVQWLTARIPV